MGALEGAAHVTTRALRAFGCLATWGFIIGLSSVPPHSGYGGVFGPLVSEVTVRILRTLSSASAFVSCFSCPSCSAKHLAHPPQAPGNHRRRLLKPLWKSHNISHTSQFLYSSPVYALSSIWDLTGHVLHPVFSLCLQVAPTSDLRLFARRNTGCIQRQHQPNPIPQPHTLQDSTTVRKLLRLCHISIRPGPLVLPDLTFSQISPFHPIATLSRKAIHQQSWGIYLGAKCSRSSTKTSLSMRGTL